MKIRYMGAHAKKRKKERKDINRVFPGKKKSLNLLVLYTEASSLNR